MNTTTSLSALNSASYTPPNDIKIPSLHTNKNTNANPSSKFDSPNSPRSPASNQSNHAEDVSPTSNVRRGDSFANTDAHNTDHVDINTGLKSNNNNNHDDVNEVSNEEDDVNNLSTAGLNRSNDVNNTMQSANTSSLQFKNYTVSNPPGTHQHNTNAPDNMLKNLELPNYLPNSSSEVPSNKTHYPTPNHTPISTVNTNTTTMRSNTDNALNLKKETDTHLSDIETSANAATSRRNSLLNKDIKTQLNELLPANIARDANGYPILSREFVVRRISEGETGRLKEELKCEACGKGYKHITSLAKHLWEHTAEWQSTKKLLISKHQQAQLLEAASILCSFSENKMHSSPTPAAMTPSTSLASIGSSNTGSASSMNDSINTPSPFVDVKDNKIYQLNHHLAPMARRKSKSESTKAGKFGGKRRSTSFGFQSAVPASLTVHHPATNSSLGPSTATNAGVGHKNHTMAHGAMRRGSSSVIPPSDLRRPSMQNIRSSISISNSRRGSLLGSLIKEEANVGNDSMVLYDSDDDE